MPEFFDPDCDTFKPYGYHPLDDGEYKYECEDCNTDFRQNVWECENYGELTNCPECNSKKISYSGAIYYG